MDVAKHTDLKFIIKGRGQVFSVDVLLKFLTIKTLINQIIFQNSVTKKYIKAKVKKHA